MRTAALLLVLTAAPCAVASAQSPQARLESDMAKAKADYDRDPSSRWT
jgi:hypothetical protein